MPDGSPAARTVLSLTAVHIEFELKVTCLAIEAVEIAERGAAGFDGACEHVADGVGQERIPCSRDPAGRSAWVYAGSKQGFARVDIADTHHDTGIHDERFDGDAPPAR